MTIRLIPDPQRTAQWWGGLVVSGGVLGSAFYIPILSCVGFFLVVPLLIVATRSTTKHMAFLYGWVFGFAFMTTVSLWMFTSYGVRWTDLDPWVSLGAVTLVILGTTVLFAALFGFGAVVVQTCAFLVLRERTRMTAMLWCLVCAGIFTAVEYARLPLFALITAGPLPAEATYSAGFIGYLGSVFAGLRQLAAFGEVSLLTFFFLMVNAVLGYAYLRFGYRGFAGAGVAVALCLGVANTVLAHGFVRENVGIIRVAGIGTALDARATEFMREEAASEAFTRASTTLQQGVDLIVFPEAFGASIHPEGVLAKVPRIASLRVTRVRDAVFVARASEGKHLFEVHKMLLVPYGEYIPYLVRSIAYAIAPPVAERLVRDFSAVPGEAGPRTVSFNTFSAAILFCNEAWGLGVWKTIRQENADMVVVIASHASFELSQLLNTQQERVLQIRAVAYGKPIVQVTNRGRSYVVDASGEILQRYASGESFLADVPLLRQP